MATKTSTAQATYQAIAALAHWLPHAPSYIEARVTALMTLLSAELNSLSFNLALQHNGTWELYGPTTPEANAWLAQLPAPLEPATHQSIRQHTLSQPSRAAMFDLPRGDRVGIVVWDKGLTRRAFDALVAQIRLALTLPDVEHIASSSGTGLREETGELTALQHIAHELKATFNLERVLHAVLRESLAVTNAQYGGIALRQGNSDTFRYLVSNDIHSREAEALTHFTLGLGNSSADIALRQGRALISSTPDTPPSTNLLFATSAMDVPIRYQDHVVGLISLRSDRIDAFNNHQLAFMHLIADQTAVAIGNAEHVAEQMRQRELLQQRASVLSEVLEVGHLLRADRPLTEMLTDIAYGISNAVGFRSVVINLRHEASPDHYQPVAFAGVLPDESERLRQSLIPAELVEQLCSPEWKLSSSYFIPDAAVLEVFGDDLERLTTTTIFEQRMANEWQSSDMFVTLLHDSAGSIIGFISVDDPFDRRRPARRTAEAVEIFANQAAIAIDNVRLYRDAQQRLAEQNALNRIHQAISASLNSRYILREVYAGLKAVLQMDSYYSVVYRHDSTTTGIEISIDDGTWHEAEMGMVEQTGLHGYMMREKQPLLFGDLAQEVNRLPASYRPQRFGNASRTSAAWMGAPLVAGDSEVIGALSVHSYTPNRFGKNELTFLQAVAHQVAISLQNARLFAERERRLQEVHVVNQLAQALTTPIGLDDLAEVLFAQLSHALQATSIMLAVYDRKHDLLEYPLYVDRGQRRRIEPRHGARGITEYILRTRRPLLLNDDIGAQLAALHIAVVGEMCQSFVGTPLLIDDQAVGVLAVQDYEQNHAFGQPQLELLQAIALQIAAGIEKARLLQERERQISQMQALNNIGKVTSSTFDVDEIFLGLYTELSRYRRANVVMLCICDPHQYTVNRLLALEDGILETIDVPRPIKPNSYTDVIMRTGRPILLRDAFEEELEYGIIPVTHGTGERTRSWAGVPLLNTTGQPFGFLSLQAQPVGEFDIRDIDFLTNVANQISLNIQNAALFRQTQEQVKQLAEETERLELINRVSNWASGLLDINELLQRTVNEMGRTANADQARLLLFDRGRGIGICQAELHNTGAVGQLTIPLLGNPAVEWIDQHHTPLLVQNVVDDPRFAPIHDLMRRENIRDILIVPLLAKGEVIGSIGLDAQARDHSFGSREIATCITIANQVATAIENARLWKTTQQSVHELTMLYDLSVSLTTMLNLDEILATLASAALEVENADVGAIVLLDHLGRLRQFAGLTRSGDDVDPELFQNNRTILEIMQQPRALVVGDLAATNQAKWLRFDAQTQSCIVVPIVVKGHSIGVLAVGTHQTHRWSEREQSLLNILAGQAASAIENAHLFKSEQEKRQLADTLREVAVSLTSTVDLQEVLEIILGQLQRVVQYDSASVQLLRDDNQLEIISGRGINQQLISNVSFPAYNPEYPNGRVLLTRQPVVVNDTQAEYPLFQQHAHAQHTRAWLGVPLIHGDQSLGMLTLDSQQPHFYTSEMADHALMFATQAAQAIASARLFEQIRRFNAELEEMVAERTAALTAEKERLEAVHTITTTLTASLDIDEIVLKTLELAAAAVGVRRGSVLLRDPMQNQLVYRAVLTESSGLLSTAEPFNLPAGNLVEWALDHQQPVLVADVRRDPRWINIGRTTNDIRSLVIVPLLAADVPLGVLMLNSRRAGYFGDEHLRLLSTIASEVAIAVHNAELYNFINEQATRLAELLQLQREETGKNRAILESVTEGVLVLDEHDTVVLYNRAANQVLQIEDIAIVGHALARIAEYGTSSEERQRALLLYDALADGVRRARQQADPLHTLVELSGQTIDTTFTPVITPDGERLGVAAVLRDITREIEADKAKREFISTVSHELRTPLTSVKGYIDLLLLGTAGPISDMQQTFLQVVKSNADRLNALVEDLLEISRLENGKVTLNIRPTNLSDLISDILASLRTETERKHMQLQLEIEPTLPTIEADTKRVAQVLTNLLSNAHKYTRDGGNITVRAYTRDELVQIDVADTGVGIPPDELPKMFSRFFRTNNSLKDEVGGTGLGLSIAKSFVELHGGDLWVTSELEVGSTFSFTLPITYQRLPIEEQSSEPNNGMSYVS